MKYSVIIPCYKCEATLEKTVASIQACGLTDFEIILVDDGSPDGTPALCDRLATEQENVRCFHQPNGGVSSARNHGLAEAKGDYVWFFDSDDLVNPGSMRRSIHIIEDYHPDMLVFGMRFEYYTRSGKVYKQLDLIYDGEGFFSKEEIVPFYDELFHCNALSSVCNKLIHRKLLEKQGVLFDEKLFAMEDYHFVLATLVHCKTIYFQRDIIYRYIHHSQKKEKKNVINRTRTSKIKNLAEYIAPFEPLLSAHPSLLLELYFTLLWQIIGEQNIEEIKKTAHQFAVSKYAFDPYCSLYSTWQSELAEQLRLEKCNELYQQMKKSRRRQQFVSLIKQNALYRAIKGTNPQKARF